MAVTLADVAERAGVSPATVSRVLNGNYPVADQTRQRVEKAVRELDYVVNAHARALLHATSGMIGLLVTDIADPYCGAIARGVQAAAEDLRRLVVVCGTGGKQSTEFAGVEMLRRHRVDVVILAGCAPDDPAYRRELAAHAKGLSAQGARLVFCDRPPPSRRTKAGVVEFDYAAGCRAAVRHLVEHGHRRIAYLAGPAGRTTTSQRREAFATELGRARIGWDDALVAEAESTRRGGFDAVRRLLASGAEFTALYSAGDLMAIGALAALKDAGVRVPDQVSVIGCGDLPEASDVTPALTTIRLPLSEAGRRSVALAFAGQGPAGPVQLEVEFVQRDSTGPARAKPARSSRPRRTA